MPKNWSQRAMAKDLDISSGKVNQLIKAIEKEKMQSCFVKKIVVRFFNLTYMEHWWVLVITAIIGFPFVVDPARLLLEDIMIELGFARLTWFYLNIFFTWIFGPIILINFFLMIFKFVKDVFTD